MEETSLTQAYHESVNSLYEYVSRRCGGDRSLAEDVVQETWLRAVVAWQKKGFPDTPIAWLKTVAGNLLRNYYRRTPSISLEVLPTNWEGKIQSGGTQWGTPDTAAAVNWGLARLRPNQSRILEAFHFEGKKVSEIASEFRLSERAVEGRLRRARLKLREKLEPVVGKRGGLS
jgi:RNA polymerase sigma-70 factor (ECF subfamily)